MSEKISDITTEVVKKVEPKFALAKLRANCTELFKINASTFDGVFYGQTASLTKAEAIDSIQKWLNKEVK